MSNIYQFEAELLDGKNKRLADYEGKVLCAMKINTEKANSILFKNLHDNRTNYT